MTPAEQIHVQGLEIARLEQNCQALRTGLQEVREICRAVVEALQVVHFAPRSRPRRSRKRAGGAR